MWNDSGSAALILNQAHFWKSLFLRPIVSFLSLSLSFCLSLSLSTSSTSEQLSTLMEHSCEPPWWMDLRQTGDERGSGATIDRKGDDLNLTEQIKREQKTCEAPEVTLQGQDSVWWIKTLWEYKYRLIENPKDRARKSAVSEGFLYFLCFINSLLQPLVLNSKRGFNRKPLTSFTFTQWIFESSTGMHNHPI